MYLKHFKKEIKSLFYRTEFWGLPNLRNVNWEFRNGIGLFLFIFYKFISAECVMGIQERNQRNRAF
jgi:hypothetical protein